MAWQSPSAMNAGGVSGTADSSGHAGTEYTLQGVMRFLQLEWHNHERARNAWDIERAEMKAKIAKQEGEVRSAKKLNDQLNKHIRMLEQALMRERSKNKPTSTDSQGAGEHKKDGKGKAAAWSDAKTSGKLPASNKHRNSFLDTEPELAELSENDKDGYREKSKLYLRKCVDEITYLLTPPSQPPPPQGLQGLGNGTGFVGHGDPAMEEMYLQHRQRLHGQLSTQAPNPPVSNQQIPSNMALSEMHGVPHLAQGLPQSASMTREPSGQLPLSHHAPLTVPETLGAPNQPPPPSFSLSEEAVERITHSFDNQGRPLPSGEEGPSAGHIPPGDSESWNFEDPSNEPTGPTPDAPPTRRPDIDIFPSANNIPVKSPPRGGPQSHRRRSSGPTSISRRKPEGHESREGGGVEQISQPDPQSFKVRFALRGHLDVVRSVIFTGGGSPSEPEICTAGDDGMIKRWIIPASYTAQQGTTNHLDIQSYFSHRGHEGIVTSLAAFPTSTSFSTGGRVSGDGWIFSGGQDATVRVWERGRVDPKATLVGHTDAVWTVCVLPANCASVFGRRSVNYGGPDRILLASGSADGTIKIWAVSAPPGWVSPNQTGSRRGVGGARRQSVTSGSNFPSSPQPSIATTTPFHYTLVHTIERPTHPSPTCISPLSPTGENFVVSFSDASILIYDTRTGEEIVGMASGETYDGTPATGITSVVATSLVEGLAPIDTSRGVSEDESVIHGATGSNSAGGVEGIVISGHEDQFIRFFDANSGQCTYSMLAHPSAISSLSLSKDGREAVSAGHDASIRFWSLEKRICTQEITSHRVMRGEGVCSVVWSQDGRLVVSAGGDGVVKVYSR